MLRFHDSFVVSEQFFELEHAGWAFVVLETRFKMVALIEDFEFCHTFVNVLHKLLQLLEINLEFVNNFSSVFFKVEIEKLFLDLAQFIFEDFLRGYGVLVISVVVFCFESFEINIAFKFNDVEHFSLELLQTVFELVIFKSNFLVDILLTFGNHQIQIVVP